MYANAVTRDLGGKSELTTIHKERRKASAVSANRSFRQLSDAAHSHRVPHFQNSPVLLSDLEHWRPTTNGECRNRRMYPFQREQVQTLVDFSDGRCRSGVRRIRQSCTTATGCDRDLDLSRSHIHCSVTNRR